MDADTLRATLLVLRERMSDQQRQIRRDVQDGDSGRYSARAPINLAEQASDEQEMDILASRLTASSQSLADIDDALDRLESGAFNVCDECGKEIGERRLTIQPWATLCVTCQRKMEEES